VPRDRRAVRAGGARGDTVKPGPDIKVNGVVHATVIDDQGTQRFPENKVVRLLYDAASLRGYNLNDLAIAIRDRHHDDDWRAFYRFLGYSVCGYADVFDDDVIENPLWDKAGG